MLPENAKKIPKFPGYYATPEGDIWSEPKKNYPGYRKLKPESNTCGYLRIRLYKERKCSGRLIHRLILETFIGPCPKGMECCHKNDIKTDNKLTNLRWDTKSNNLRDAYKNKRRSTAGDNHPRAKLNSLQVRVIKHLLCSHTLTQREIGNIFNVSRGCIKNIKNNRSWKEV